jgi:hypothetical protein
MECILEVSQHPTAAEMIPLIEDEQRRNAAKGRRSYIAKLERGYRSHWWRKGIKERDERLPLDSPDQRPFESVTAFDGQIVRNLRAHGPEVVGSIETPDQAAWQGPSGANTIQPFSLLYEFRREPYSRLVADGLQFEASAVSDGNGAVRVSFQQREFPENQFVFTFDNHERLLERRLITKMEPYDSAPRVYEVHSFGGYERFQDVSGEVIWFPLQCRVEYVMGVAPAGELIKYQSRDVHIKNVKFNPDIPDELFVLNFPTEAKVNDRLHGLSITGQDDLVESSRLTAAKQPPRSGASRVAISLGAVGLLLILVALATWAKARIAT